MKHGRTAVVIGMAWLMCAMPALQPIAVYAESVQDSSVSLAQESTVQASPTGDALAGTVGTDADQAGKSNDIGVLDGATSDASGNATENGSPSESKIKANSASVLDVDATDGQVDVSDDKSESAPVLTYQAHVQDYGWMTSVSAGELAGTTGKSKRMEALKLSVKDAEGNEISDALSIKAHVSNIGWMDPVGNDAIVGTVGQSRQLEAIAIQLSAELSQTYSVWYRVHSSNFGWLDWTCDGANAGTEGYGYSVEAVEIVILAKDVAAPGGTDVPFKSKADEPAIVTYSTHVSNVGWMSVVSNGATAGAPGAECVESLDTRITWFGGSAGIQVRSHVQDQGWGSWYFGRTGTTGLSRRIEALQMRLTGDAANAYDIWYRVYSARYNAWLGWAANGAAAGTVGMSSGVQAVQIVLVKKGQEAPGSTEGAFKGSEHAVLQGAGLRLDGSTVGSGSDSTVVIGSEDSTKPLKSFALNVNNQACDGSILYQSGSQYGSMPEGVDTADGGWTTTLSDGLAMRCVRISLSGTLSTTYDVWYQVFDGNTGKWTGWASNGLPAGSASNNAAICAVRVCLLEKDAAAPGSTDGAYVESDSTDEVLSAQGHVAEIGWQTASLGTDVTVGTTGRALSLQALRVGAAGPIAGSVSVAAHVEEEGWQNAFVAPGFAGTTGKSRAVQAVRMNLTDELAEQYDIYYRVHVAGYGWLSWTRNGADAGTTGLGVQAEAVQIRLVKKGETAPATGANACISMPVLSYSAHVSNIGWMGAVSNNGFAGTQGRSLKVEDLRLSVSSSISGGIKYSAHVQDCGWRGWASNGASCGTTGQNKRLEAIKIQLSGDLSKYFDVWYRAYVQDYGWLGWAANGAQAGTVNIGYRLEGIQIQILPKGAAAPGSTYRPFTDIPVMPADQFAMLQKANRYASSTNWLLLVDTSRCRVGVYNGNSYNWNQVFYWQCSPGAWSTPTVLGEFAVYGKGYSFGHGYTCYYYTQFYGDYLFHSVPYDQGTFNIQDGRLGQNVSQGCVRLDIQNAKWIYDNIPYGTKVVTYR